MKHTVTPKDLIYKVKPRSQSVALRFNTLFRLGGRRVETMGVYRIGSIFGGRIAMY